MKILFFADGRSPTALNWISYFVDRGDEVHLVSMYPCRPDIKLASLSLIPVRFSGGAFGQSQNWDQMKKYKVLKTLVSPGLRTWLRHQLVPGSLPKAASTLKSIITRLKPDLVHGMRVPYEGMTASLTYQTLPKPNPPLLISIWGNDFTLHAPATGKMGKLTRQTLEAADGLHTDCIRDRRIARLWGFDTTKPAIVLPGAGGIQLKTFFPGRGDIEPIVINPRGFRAYIRNDVFFKSIPLILANLPNVKFICPSMKDNREAEQWVKSLGVEQAVQLLPRQTRSQMAVLYRQSQVVVSPSTHDGTPNTILEAMACGCFPVVGDLESLREWITPGVNGLLIDPNDPQLMAEAICTSLENPNLRNQAQDINLELVKEKVEYQAVMKKAEGFYKNSLSGVSQK